MTIKIKRLHPDAQIPSRAHPTDSGADLYALADVTLQMDETALVDTGIALELPSGYEAQVRPRSSLSKNGIWAAFGTIDESYRGPVKVVLSNFGRTYTVRKGERIAQLVICPVSTPNFEEVQELSDTDRGSGGFGSTGL
jgi:dUTP pyrophosphatase